MSSFKDIMGNRVFKHQLQLMRNNASLGDNELTRIRYIRVRYKEVYLYVICQSHFDEGSDTCNSMIKIFILDLRLRKHIISAVLRNREQVLWLYLNESDEI